MEGTSFKNLLIGFVAGAIALVTVHELIALCLADAGHISRTPWSLETSGLTGLPQIVTDVVWGGVWGMVFAAILGDVPQGSMTVRGAVLGIVGPALIGVLVLVPLVRGETLFLNADPDLIWPVLVLGAGFGAATAWLYGLFTAGGRLP
ncbi:hypothetical protein W911_01705 [Hyphomicrobium nitrativorans NL23]|uniref:Uncharacterized protein n=1 Tax=Hyphomicrobium nitrativorans NL23 TaxID=1029756 RepID=V5SAD3_9HYPH|nr:hypothetical protein [Hyphomicrobium nitrativorans]AHB47397.1 hypothetical protein W911_01705 [Hyphomicrobium nitrativorans NL23]